MLTAAVKQNTTRQPVATSAAQVGTKETAAEVLTRKKREAFAGAAGTSTSYARDVARREDALLSCCRSVVRKAVIKAAQTYWHVAESKSF